jgi:hypothetical protein
MRSWPAIILAALLALPAGAFELIPDRPETAPGGIVTLLIDGVSDLPSGWVWQLQLGPTIFYLSNETAGPDIVSLSTGAEGNVTMAYRIPLSIVPGDRQFLLYVYRGNVSVEKKGAAPFRIRPASFSVTGPRTDPVPGAALTAVVDGLPVPGTVRAYLANGSWELAAGNASLMPFELALAIDSRAKPGNNTITFQVNGTDYAQFPFPVAAIEALLNLSGTGALVPGRNMTVVVERPAWRSHHAVLFDDAVLWEERAAASRLTLSLRVPDVPAFSQHRLRLLVNNLTVSEYDVTAGRPEDGQAVQPVAPAAAPSGPGQAVQPQAAPAASAPGRDLAKLEVAGKPVPGGWYGVGGFGLLLALLILMAALRRKRTAFQS